MFSINLVSVEQLLQPLWAIVIGDRWQAGIGDPSLMGWLTVVFYFMGAVLCFTAAWRTSLFLPLYRLQHYCWLWLLLGLSLVILGINKQLDLQSWLTVFGKKLALSQGWYMQRRYVQATFISLVVFLFVYLFIGLRRLIGKDWKIFRLTFLGFLFLSGFIVIRAASFHHIDRLLGFQFAGFRVNGWLEIGGLCCLGLSCLNYLKYLERLRLKG